MPEMILPGTYIEVRAEKLIAPGPISIGNVGIVGTARRGRLAAADDPTSIYLLTSVGQARDIFGEADAFEDPARTGAELTLVRAVELAFSNGAQRVFAGRVADSAATAATYNLGGVTFTAKGPGSGYNEFVIKATASDVANTVNVSIARPANEAELAKPADKRRLVLLESWRRVPNTVTDFVEVINGTHTTYNFASLSSTSGGSDYFSTSGTTGTVPGRDTPATAGTQGAGENIADAGDYKVGLDGLTMQDVHIVVAAGQAAATMGATLVGHVESASSDLIRRERIGVIGGTSTTIGSITPLPQDEGRVVFVAPGIVVNDTALGRPVTLPATYTAAAIAGRISSLDPHVSPTNKTINADKLQKDFNGAELEQLVLNNVLVLESRRGAIRTVRGVTSSTNTAWTQITTRRIVDYARFGTRAAANPFIGKLNNERVRQAMKGSINSLLADMIDREMLVGYKLEVTATREQQIRGICQVTMVLQPTFSIDYIRVIMYLE